MKKQTIKALILAGAGLLARKNAWADAEVLYTPNTAPAQKNKIESALNLLAETHPHSAVLKYRPLPSAADYIGDIIINPNQIGAPTYPHGTNRINVSSEDSLVKLAEYLNHEGLHLASTLSSPELVALNKALTHGGFYAYMARSMQSEAASWADSTMFMLQSEGRAEFIRESIEKSRDYDLLRLGTKPDMINYWIPMNYIHALVDYYYGGDLDMTEAQKDWAICDEIYNNFYKNGHYLNELMMSGSRMAGNIRFMGTKYADDRAANIFLERYMQLTCPQGITRTLTGATLLEAIHLVATDSKTDILLDIKGDWAKARDILKGNFEEVGPLWEHNSRMVAISPSIRQPFDPREVETHFGNIYSLPTDEEYELLDDLLDASQQRTAPANTWSR